MDQGLEDGLTLDVAIVGGGISGLYAGWRLQSGVFHSKSMLPKPPKTHVFELSERIGGRLVTAFLDGMPHVRCNAFSPLLPALVTAPFFGSAALRMRGPAGVLGSRELHPVARHLGKRKNAAPVERSIVR